MAGDDTIGGYRLERQLGFGAFGSVHLGVAPDGSEVAVKLLDRAAGPVEMFRDQLLAEADALRAVASPYTLRVLDVVDEAGRLALVTDLVPGVSLREVLDTHGNLSGPDALTVLHGAASGLAAVHAAGLVHGDVKPANLLVRPDGISTLIDFGLASLPGWVSADSMSPWGTPAYASPEQVVHDYRDARSDIYSLTVMLYEVLCGTRPFGGETLERIRQNQAYQPLPDPRWYVPDLGDGLTQLLLWGLSKDSTQRPPDVATWLAYLEAAAQDRYGADWRAAGSVAAVVGGMAAGALVSGVFAGGAAVASGVVGGTAVAGGAAGGAAAASVGAGATTAGVGATAAGTGSAVTATQAGFIATGLGKAAVGLAAAGLVAGGGVAVNRVVNQSDPPRTVAAAPVAPKMVDKIAFVRCSEGIDPDCTINLVNPDGSGEQQLLDTGMPTRELAFSPDGRQLAYVVTRGDMYDTEIRVVGTDGSGDHKLVKGWSPSWSPDGKRVAYTNCESSNCSTDSVMKMIDADGSGDHVIDSEGGGDSTWSPDGSRLAYVHQAYEIGGCGFIGFDGFVINADGTGRRALEKMGTSPRWTLDGKRLFFDGESDTEFDQDCQRLTTAVRSASASGGDRSELRAPAFGAQLSPDGQHVAFFDYPAGAHAVLSVMGPSGNGVRGLGIDIWGEYVWSPESDRLLYVGTNSTGDVPPPMSIIDVATGSTRQLTTGTEPVWGRIPAPTTPTPSAKPAITAPQAKNLLIPAGTCGDGVDTWDQYAPIQLRNGSGEKFSAPDRERGAYIQSTRFLGTVDTNSDGIGEAVLRLRCSGTPSDMCCAGVTSIMDVVVVLDVSGDQPTRVGDTIWPTDGSEDDAYRLIRKARVRGQEIRTVERWAYPDSYTKYGDVKATFRHRFVAGKWTSEQL